MVAEFLTRCLSAVGSYPRSLTPRQIAWSGRPMAVLSSTRMSQKIRFGTPRGEARCNILSHVEDTMDKDRIKGSAEQAKGSVKEAAGKVTGDTKLQAEG